MKKKKTQEKSQADRIKEYRFKTDRPESCTATVTLRIPPSLKSRLKDTDNWQEQARQALEKIVEPQSA